MRSRLLALVVAVALGGCTAPPALPGALSTLETADTAAVTIRGPDGQRLAFEVEVAADRRARRQGLMHRTELAADGGMLFVFPHQTSAGFSMRDTPLPLSIAFASVDGTIVTVRDMAPCPARPCPSYRSAEPYRLALEVHQGALEAVEPGWRLEVEHTSR